MLTKLISKCHCHYKTHRSDHRHVLLLLNWHEKHIQRGRIIKELVGLGAELKQVSRLITIELSAVVV
jgi:hypothetical protein